jgi:hypothetical protein
MFALRVFQADQSGSCATKTKKNRRLTCGGLWPNLTRARLM